MSDVFVVPNLNVLFQEVIHVYWDEDECSGLTSDKISFELDNPGNDPAVAFYSRWHVMYIKIPELERALNYTKSRVDSMDSGDHICCCPPKCSEESCPCEEKDKKDERDRLALLDEGLQGWRVALDTASTGEKTKVPIMEWFDVIGKRKTPMTDLLKHFGYGIRKEGKIEGHPASISPVSLLNDATSIGSVPVEMTVVDCEHCCGSYGEESDINEEIDSRELY